MKDLIRKRDIDYISAPIAPVLKGENVHYEYVAFRKQIEDISPVPAIPIPEGATNGDMVKMIFPDSKIIDVGNQKRIWLSNQYLINCLLDWWNRPYKRGDTE